MDFKLEDLPGDDLSAWFSGREYRIYDNEGDLDFQADSCLVCGALVRSMSFGIDDRPLHIKFHRSLGQQP
jgi:hypothetical protein